MTAVRRLRGDWFNTRYFKASRASHPLTARQATPATNHQNGSGGNNPPSQSHTGSFCWPCNKCSPLVSGGTVQASRLVSTGGLKPNYRMTTSEPTDSDECNDEGNKHGRVPEERLLSHLQCLADEPEVGNHLLNLITLCEDCHQIWEKSNPDIDVERLSSELQSSENKFD